MVRYRLSLKLCATYYVRRKSVHNSANLHNEIPSMHAHSNIPSDEQSTRYFNYYTTRTYVCTLEKLRVNVCVLCVSHWSSVEESHWGLQDGVEEFLVEDCGGTDASIGIEEGSEQSEHLPQNSFICISYTSQSNRTRPV